MSKESVKVVARFRPFTQSEKAASRKGNADFSLLIEETAKIVGIRSQDDTHNFAYDGVYGTEAAQQRVFDECARDAVLSMFEGYASTVFAYGQTGTGKTYTMFGPPGADHLVSQHKGVIPRAAELLYSEMPKLKDNAESIVKCSFLEIYKEQVHDLLQPPEETRVRGEYTRTNLKIRHSRDHNKGIYVEGLTEKYVHSAEEILAVIEEGERTRSTASTNVNERSSRSHSVFTIHLSLTSNDGERKSGKLHLVDLAGSENVRKTKATGQTLNEAKQINKSLSALGNVIFSLTTASRGHVPYRDSKLTFLLQDSLGGGTKTVLLVTCSPGGEAVDETLSTLKFARRAKHIQNQPIVHREVSAILLKQRVAELEDQLDSKHARTEEMLILLKGMGVVEDGKGGFKVPSSGAAGGSRRASSSLSPSSPSSSRDNDGGGAAALAEFQAREVRIMRQLEKVNSKYSKLKKKYFEEVEYNSKIKQLFLKQRTLATALTKKIIAKNTQLADLQAERDGLMAVLEQSNVTIPNEVRKLHPSRRPSMSVVPMLNDESMADEYDEDYSPPPSPTRVERQSEASEDTRTSSGSGSGSGMSPTFGAMDSSVSLSIPSTPRNRDPNPGQMFLGTEEILPPLHAAERVLEKGGVFVKYPYSGGRFAKATKKQIFYESRSRQLFYWDVNDGLKTTSKFMPVSGITDIYVGRVTEAFQRKAAKDALESRSFSIKDGSRTLDLEAESPQMRDLFLSALYLVSETTYNERKGGGQKFRIHDPRNAMPNPRDYFPTLPELPPDSARGAGPPQPFVLSASSASFTESSYTFASNAATSPPEEFSVLGDDGDDDDNFQSLVESKADDDETADNWLAAKPTKKRHQHFYVRALYKYESQSKNQLSFKKHDIIKILKKKKQGWWKAKIDEAIGYVPSNYLTELFNDEAISALQQQQQQQQQQDA